MNQEGQASAQDPDAEQQNQEGAAPAKAPAIPAGMRRVRLTRSIVLGGNHAEAGSVHDVSQSLAHRLVGEGSAEHTQHEDKPTSVNRMVTPTNADPAPRQVSPAPPKGGPAKKGK